MIEPYRMVVVNCIIFGLLSAGIVIYIRFINKKKIPIHYLPLLLIISLLPLVSVLRKGTYESGSLSDYVKFSYSFYESLREGNIIPRWDAFRCGGYGCPQFEYMYILPYYIVSFFHAIGFSFISSLKLLLSFAYIISGLGMYLFVRKDYGAKAGFIAGIFYLFAPYHLSDLHFSSDIGEMLAFALVPFVFYFFSRTATEDKKQWILFSGVSFSLLILAHHVIALSVTPILTVYLLFKIQKKKHVFSTLKRFFLCFLTTGFLSVFYWLPILAESKYIFWGKNASLSFIHEFHLFFFTPWRYGLLYQGPNGELSFLLGYVHWLVLAFAAIWLYKSKRNNKDYSIILLLFLTVVVLFFLMQPISRSIWESIPVVEKFQFSYRLLLPIAFLCSLLGSIILRNYKENIIFLICFTVVGITILNWGNRRTIPEVNDNYLINELKTKEPVFQVTIPNSAKYSRLDRLHSPKSAAKVAKGKAGIILIKRSTTVREYTIHAEKDSFIRENIFAYPGWSISANNKLISDSYQNITDKKTGLIAFNLKEGIYYVVIAFRSSPIRKIADTLSLLSIIAIAIYVVKEYLAGKARR